MISKHTYSDELRKTATHLSILGDECGIDEFRIALTFNNKPVYFFKDGQYVLAKSLPYGGYGIDINNDTILQKNEIDEIEDVFFDLIKNINSMLRTNVTTLKMPITSVK